MQNANDLLWTSGFFNERFPAPISPLGWSLLGPLIEEIALRDPLRFLGYPDAEKIPLTRLWHGHPYANALAFHIFYKVFPDFILPEDAYRYFLNGEVNVRKRAPYPSWTDSPRLVVSLLRAFFSDPLNVSPLNNHRHWRHYAHEHDRRVAALRVRFDALVHTDPREIFAGLREAENIHRDLLRIHRWSLMDADLTFGLLKRMVGSNNGAAHYVADVPNKTLEVDVALRRLYHSERIEREASHSFDNGTLRSAQGDKLLDAFLAEHGHRSFSLDIAVPTFADDPSQVTHLLHSMTAAEGKQTAILTGKAQFSIRVRPVAFLARQYIAMREDQRYFWQKSLAVSRHLYLLLADHLVVDKVIADRNSVFYATHQELFNYFEQSLAKSELAQSIAARQSEWQEYYREFEKSSTESYPSFLRGNTVVGVRRNLAGIAKQWRGRAVSSGIARGIARIVQSPNDLSRVQRGEILVAPTTDPGWTPVFSRIAGLVVERGGVLSHSAVVAREYHVPTVVGIPNVVIEIHDGDVIEVDGSKGVVRAIV